jgi:hypothetical protein
MPGSCTQDENIPFRPSARNNSTGSGNSSSPGGYGQPSPTRMVMGSGSPGMWTKQS